MLELVILDLEWNGTYSRRKKGYINEIIEFGAVKCDESLNLLDEFSLFVKPQVTKRLNAVISDLTSITDETLTDGVTFMRAVSRFKKWAGGAVIMTWGTSDVLALIENCRYFNAEPTVPFLHKYCDLQEYAESKLGTGASEQLGLSKAAEALQLDIGSAEMHRAIDDSRVSLDVLRRIYNKDEIETRIQICDDTFYNKILFKTSYISDLKHPLIKRHHLRFACPKCGAPSERKTRWQLKNKSFRAEFLCRECKYPFAARVIFKEKYEGLAVNRKTFPLPQIEKPRKAEAAEIGSMQLEIAENGVGLLRFHQWFHQFGGIKGITHAFSTRIGGVSAGEYAAMNLGFGRGDSDENVGKNYLLLCEAMGIESENLIAGAQDHHTVIRRVGAEEAGIGIWKPKDMDSVDGLCTNEPGMTLVVYCADCVPLYFYDAGNRAIGLAHAGWKGTAANMAQAMVDKMRMEFGSKPEDLQVAIGPSICKDCFEVDAPVARVFQALPKMELFVEDTGDGKFHVDLWECNRRFLLAAGVKEKNIEVSGVCSMQNSDLVFSHRRTRGRRGSNAAFLTLRK